MYFFHLFYSSLLLLRPGLYKENVTLVSPTPCSQLSYPPPPPQASSNKVTELIPKCIFPFSRSVKLCLFWRHFPPENFHFREHRPKYPHFSENFRDSHHNHIVQFCACFREKLAKFSVKLIFS